MNSDHDQQLEQMISRELKSLPELDAPDSLTDRVLAAIERRVEVPWYCRSWEAWPVALRLASLALMLMLFGGLCLAGWEMPQTEFIRQTAHRAGEWLSGFNTIESTLHILVESAGLVMKKLGAPFIVVALIAAGLGYAMFLGFGTACFRLVYAKNSSSHL
jgi:hypothetical protein